MLKFDGDGSPTTPKRRGQGWLIVRPRFVVPVLTLIIIIQLAVIRTHLKYAANVKFRNSPNPAKDSGLTCIHGDSCEINIVESISIGLVYPNGSVLHPSIYRSWMTLISVAQFSIELTSLHIALRREDDCPNCDSARQVNTVNFSAQKCWCSKS